VSISCPSRVVSTEKKTHRDIHKASYIYFVKIIVSNITTEGNLKVYEMTENQKKKSLCERDSLLSNKSGRVYVYASSYTLA
jgi:hypothetical protein